MISNSCSVRRGGGQSVRLLSARPGTVQPNRTEASEFNHANNSAGGLVETAGRQKQHQLEFLAFGGIRFTVILGLGMAFFQKLLGDQAGILAQCQFDLISKLRIFL